MSEQKPTLEQIISGIAKTISGMKYFSVHENENEFVIRSGKYRFVGCNHPLIAHEIASRLNTTIENIKTDLQAKSDAAREHLEQTELDLFSDRKKLTPPIE